MRVQIGRRTVRAAGLGHGGGLPILGNGGGRVPSREEAELLGIGPGPVDRPPTVLPYRQQDAYDRVVADSEQRVAVMENEYLRAEFLLDLGGRLWSLFDKKAGRELFHQPDWIQHGNLALRNAWFAGGVEWNLGVTGHWALTSEPVAAAVVGGEDAPSLRLWAYERMLELVWQVDVSLPAGSAALYVHATLHNPHGTDRPVYWWSNIAVPQTRGMRVLVDARTAYLFGYKGLLHEVPIPEHEGIDVTRPERAMAAADYFFRTDADHPWIAAVGADGYGLGHASTSRLRSRKLFVWGNSAGGRTWQRWLGGESEYIEIQAGLASTQLEHLRLPAGETWSWTEAYRAVSISRDAVDGEWVDAVAAGAQVAVQATELDAEHERLVARAAAPVASWDARAAGENQAWGALAVAVGDLPENPATPFSPSTMGSEQRGWLEFARTGRVPKELAGSVLVGEGWLQRLREAETSPAQQLLRGYAEHAVGDTVLARELWQQSADAEPTAQALHALAATTHDVGAAADLLTRALPLASQWEEPALDGLLVATLAALQRAGRPREVLDVIGTLPERQRGLPRVAFAECRALVDVGELDAAEALLARPLVVPDLREGDRSLDELWFDYQRGRGTEEPLPPHYDFRMFGGHVEEG